MRTLLVAGAGGHLEEMWLLRPRLVGVPAEVSWATPDTVQSRALLRGERLVPIPRSNPRDVRGTLSTARNAFELLRRGGWTAVVSTGSLPAVPFLTIARALGIPCHFIESAARVDEPSMSARILERVPGVHRYGQYRTWTTTRQDWHFRGSVFDGFIAVPGPGGPVRRVVVTVGSSRYGFRRLVDDVRRVLPPDVEVLWQTGSTDVSDLPIDGRVALPATELADQIARADLVIAHAGVGSALMALRAGKCPILLPRQSSRGEHVDDHQHQVAAALADAGLAVVAQPGSLAEEHLTRAMGSATALAAEPAPFVLQPN
ncbi:MAG: glycosyltransferase [Acidimicrobiales bacterium]